MLWRVWSRPIRTRSNPPGFVQPCQPALADRPPSGPGWACGLGLEGIVSKRIASRYVSGEVEEPPLSAYLTRMLSNAAREETGSESVMSPRAFKRAVYGDEFGIRGRSRIAAVRSRHAKVPSGSSRRASRR